MCVRRRKFGYFPTQEWIKNSKLEASLLRLSNISLGVSGGLKKYEQGICPMNSESAIPKAKFSRKTKEFCDFISHSWLTVDRRWVASPPFARFRKSPTQVQQEIRDANRDNLKIERLSERPNSLFISSSQPGRTTFSLADRPQCQQNENGRRNTTWSDNHRFHRRKSDTSDRSDTFSALFFLHGEITWQTRNRKIT